MKSIIVKRKDSSVQCWMSPIRRRDKSIANLRGQITKLKKKLLNP